jgi:ABC-2 type transport system ATP-binding protein
MATAAISVSDLSKTYGAGLFGGAAVQALDAVSLTVPKGEIFGLLGPNGAGKTTLIKILLGLVHATDGQAHLLGQPVQRPATRRRVGYLPETHRFPGFLTAGQTLQIYARLADVPDPPRRSRISDLLAHVGLGEHRDAKVKTFSKGMLQRLGIAQALLSDPDLLFLDEPTSGVDPVGRRAIRDLVLELRDSGATIFLNSHLLSEVEKVCSQIAILRDGAVVREGTIQELTAVERVYDLVSTPIPDALRQELPLDPSPEDAPPDPALRQYRLRAEDRAALNALLDRLRGADVQVDSLVPLRRSLEDYFIDVVDETAPAPGDAAA